MNIVCEIGRLTSDVELKVTVTGKSVCTFTIAVYRNKETTDFLPCVAWKDTAERISRYFKKGSLIGIEGALHSRSYEDRNKNKRTVLEIAVDSVSFCESIKENTNNEPEEEASQEAMEFMEELPFL